MRNFVRAALVLAVMAIVAVGAVVDAMNHLSIEKDGEQINISVYGHVWVYELD